MKVLSFKKSPQLISALRIFWGNIRKNDRNAPETDKLRFLKKIPFFESLRRHQLELVAQFVHERDYNENEYIFEIGQPGAALFIIQSGEVSVEIPGDTESYIQIAVLGKNAFLGELALLDESARSASARALKPSRTLALFRSDLERISNDDPKTAAQIYKSLAHIVGQRLKATNELLDKKAEAA